MNIRVVPLPNHQSQGIKFDALFEDGYIKTFEVDEYKLRHYRSASIADIIEQILLDYLADNGYSIDSVSITYL